MTINPTELEKKLNESFSKQTNNQNCHEMKINKKFPTKYKTEIKQIASEKEGYADACTIIPQNDIMIYNVVKRVIDDNKINDYNSIPLVIKKYITEKFIESKLIKNIDEETFIELASYFNQVKNQHMNAQGDIYTKETEETVNEYRDIINKIIFFQGCTIEIIGNWIWISGDTKNYKEALKELKFRWAPNKKAWSYHNGTYRKQTKKQYSLEDLRNSFESTRINNRQVELINA